MTSQTITFPGERPECAEHRVKIANLERDLAKEELNRGQLSDKLDSLKNLVIATLATALMGLLAQLAVMHKP